MKITEILTNCPKGRFLYCPFIGTIVFDGLFKTETDGESYIQCHDLEKEYKKYYFSNNGIFKEYPHGECMLFLRKSQTDWQQWKKYLLEEGDIVAYTNGDIGKYTVNDKRKVERFASEGEYTFFLHHNNNEIVQPNDATSYEFRPFDKIIVGNIGGTWNADFYSHKTQYGVCTTSHLHYKYCLPYIDKYEQLLGTTCRGKEDFINL